jgi:hypothetical protein
MYCTHIFCETRLSVAYLERLFPLQFLHSSALSISVCTSLFPSNTDIKYATLFFFCPFFFLHTKNSQKTQKTHKTHKTLTHKKTKISEKKKNTAIWPSRDPKSQSPLPIFPRRLPPLHGSASIVRLFRTKVWLCTLHDNMQHHMVTTPSLSPQSDQPARKIAALLKRAKKATKTSSQSVPDSQHISKQSS